MWLSIFAEVVSTLLGDHSLITNTMERCCCAKTFGEEACIFALLVRFILKYISTKKDLKKNLLLAKRDQNPQGRINKIKT